MSSAENELAIESQPFTTTDFEAQISRTALVSMIPSP
jgi:hypothetical protein